MSKLQDIMLVLKENQRLLQRQEQELSALKNSLAEHSRRQESMERQLKMYATSGVQPKRYNGSEATESARLFISDFESFSRYLHPADEAAILRLFPVFLAGRAKIWYEQHKVGSLPGWAAQREAFLNRFRPSLQTELNALPQRKQQRMPDYIKACSEKIFSLAITDEESKIQMFLEGLLPAYKDFVMETQPTTLEEAERHALRAERNLST